MIRRTVELGALAVISFVLAACGGEAPAQENGNGNGGPCMAPTGTYSQEIVEVTGGSCSSGFVNEATGTYDFELTAEQAACGQHTDSISWTYFDQGVECTVSGQLTYEITQNGIENGSEQVNVSCANGTSCSHQFNHYFELR